MTWNEILKEAEKQGLITMSYGGVAILMTYENQKEKGIYHDTQYKCGLGPHPSKIKEK